MNVPTADARNTTASLSLREFAESPDISLERWINGTMQKAVRKKNA